MNRLVVILMLTGLVVAQDGKQEPVDVPTIEVPAESVVYYPQNCNTESHICFGDIAACTNGGEFANITCPPHQICISTKCVNGHVSSCADKRRVLLTSEDGKKHCILFKE